MEQINDRELGIIGERYGSFLEAYRVNDRRSLNAACAMRGDGTSQRLFEADDGIVFAPAQTREALLYGSDLYSGRYREMRKRVRKTMLERYEWMEDERFGADVRGEHVIMERYAIGHPEAFHRKRSTVRQKRSVEIVYDAMCPASTPVSKRIESGCIVAACADALERIGYEVALTFALATYDGNSMSEAPTLLLEVALKGYGDALNVKKLEFPLAAKPVLFHLGIWWAHRFPFSPGDFGEGEGYPVSYDARRVRALEAHARARHGAYLSEDIIEMQLKMDPTKALERILGEIGEAEVLEEHMVAKSSMQAGQSPSQGKLFGGARSEDPLARHAQGEGGEQEAREEDARGDAAGGRCSGSARAQNDGRRESGALPHAPRQRHGGAGAMAGGSQGAGPGVGGGDGDGDSATGDGGDDGGRADGADSGRSAAASGQSASGAGRGDTPGASERAGDAPGDGGGSGSNARKPTEEAHQDTDDVEPGSDGLAGFGGLSGAPEAAGQHGGGAGGRGNDDGERNRQLPDAQAQDAASGQGDAPGGRDNGDDGAPGSDDGTGAPSAGAGGSSAQQDAGGDSASGSGSGPFSPSSSGSGDTQGGGGAGGQRDRDEDEDGEQDESDGQDASEQGEAMNDDTREKREELDPQGPGELEPQEDQQPDGTGHDAIPDADSQPSPEDSPRENVGDEDLDDPVRDSFIVELRKRYVRFEHGDYRRMKEKEAREAQVGAGAGASSGRSVMAPPVAPVTGSDDYEFGTPRSSPFSMTYVPKRKS